MNLYSIETKTGETHLGFCLEVGKGFVWFRPTALSPSNYAKIFIPIQNIKEIRLLKGRK